MAGLLRDRVSLSQSHNLISKGIDARYVNLDCVVPNALRKVDLDQSFYTNLAKAIAEEVLKCGGAVPVVTGYFGVVPGSLLSAIGRGYTDLCAALLAVGLAAEELQIWKEVDGIFTADPRKVPTARLLSSITPEEAAELTFFGSEVLKVTIMWLIIGCASFCV
jgi:aspartate kinase